MSPDIDVRFAADKRALEDARRLFLEYAASLPFQLDFQHFDEEMSDFPASYAPPAGAIALAFAKDEPAGVVALRPLVAPEVCELKRLYVLPAFRGLGIGERLVAALVSEARSLGYRRMRLDTHVPSMGKAITLYRRLGFVEIDPPPGALESFAFMELALM